MNEELIDYYKNLLILQYRNKTKSQKHIKNIGSNSMIFDIIKDVENGYNIDTAVGIQLDILSKYVNAKRVISQFAFTRNFWSLVDYNQPTPYVDLTGIINYSQAIIPDATMLAYETDQKPSYSLSDEEMRIIIKLKIIQNNSNYSAKSIDDLIFLFFDNDVIFNDNFNMNVEYVIDESVRRLIEIARAEDALPKPIGVGLELTFTPDIKNMFGFINYKSIAEPNFLEGFIDYSDSPFGGWLNY